MIFRKKPKTEQVIMMAISTVAKQHVAFLRQCSEDPEMREITGQQACLELAASLEEALREGDWRLVK